MVNHKLTFVSSPDLHSPQTTANLAALLLAPVNSYQSVLTLLALQQYIPLLNQQPFSTRRSLAQGLVSSVLKNETIIEAPEDVDGILELCSVLIKDQNDVVPPVPSHGSRTSMSERRPGIGGPHEKEDLAEEQGWIARMVHLFRAESLDVQFEVWSRPQDDHRLLLIILSSSYKLPVVTLRLEVNECDIPTLH